MPNEPILEPHGKGFLVIDGRVESQGMKAVAPGVCPSCETPLGPWSPPVDAKYLQRIASLKEAHSLESDQAGHEFQLKREGGIIHTCTCGTSYFVPASAVEIKS